MRSPIRLECPIFSEYNDLGTSPTSYLSLLTSGLISNTHLIMMLYQKIRYSRYLHEQMVFQFVVPGARPSATHERINAMVVPANLSCNIINGLNNNGNSTTDDDPENSSNRGFWFETRPHLENCLRSSQMNINFISACRTGTNLDAHFFFPMSSPHSSHWTLFWMVCSSSTNSAEFFYFDPAQSHVDMEPTPLTEVIPYSVFKHYYECIGFVYNFMFEMPLDANTMKVSRRTFYQQSDALYDSGPLTALNIIHVLSNVCFRQMDAKLIPPVGPHNSNQEAENIRKDLIVYFTLRENNFEAPIPVLISAPKSHEKADGRGGKSPRTSKSSSGNNSNGATSGTSWQAINHEVPMALQTATLPHAQQHQQQPQHYQRQPQQQQQQLPRLPPLEKKRRTIEHTPSSPKLLTTSTSTTAVASAPPPITETNSTSRTKASDIVIPERDKRPEPAVKFCYEFREAFPKVIDAIATENLILSTIQTFLDLTKESTPHYELISKLSKVRFRRLMRQWSNTFPPDIIGLMELNIMGKTFMPIEYMELATRQVSDSIWVTPAQCFDCLRDILKNKVVFSEAFLREHGREIFGGAVKTPEQAQKRVLEALDSNREWFLSAIEWPPKYTRNYTSDGKSLLRKDHNLIAVSPANAMDLIDFCFAYGNLSKGHYRDRASRYKILGSKRYYKCPFWVLSIAIKYYGRQQLVPPPPYSEGPWVIAEDADGSPANSGGENDYAPEERPARSSKSKGDFRFYDVTTKNFNA